MKPAKPETLTALAHAWEISRAQPIPAPGRYALGTTRSNGLYGTGRPCDVQLVADVEASPAGAPLITATFHSHGRKPVRRSIRVAIDGSWRDAATLLPVNAHGEIVGQL